MENFAETLQRKINVKTKPLGALGELEKIAFKIGKIQHSLTPQLTNPHILVFAGDHGIAQQGVSAYPKEVTPQMVLNFLNGGAAINVFCKQNDIQIAIIDAGVHAIFDRHPQLIDAKIRKSTRNFLKEPAMTEIELEDCLERSSSLINDIAKKNCNILGFGEMGIGNTSSAALLVTYLTGLSLEKCVGRGTGLDDEQLKNKRRVLQDVLNFHGPLKDPKKVLQTVGGYEIAQMTGAMLAAYQNNMTLMIDGFIASAAFLVAYKLQPEILKNAIFCHCSDENGHRFLLEYFNERPLLNLQLRLGEGTGCALAYPLIQAAVNFLNEMASFESAGVSNKTD